MPRYHFHLEDGTALRDEDGTELPDLDAARVNAVQLLGAVLAGDAGQFLSTSRWMLTVTDDADSPLFRMRVAVDAMTDRSGQAGPAASRNG